MTVPLIKTACWFDKLPDDHQRIGISRGTPRGVGPGYRTYRKLAPGPWFHSVDPEEYYRLYKAEILSPLNPHEVAAELAALSQGRIPTLLCFERVGSWCHRAMVAEWLARGLGIPVPEFRFEGRDHARHPLMPPLADRAEPDPDPDPASFIGRSAMIDGEQHLVTRLDPDVPGNAIVEVGDRWFSTGPKTLARHFR